MNTVDELMNQRPLTAEELARFQRDARLAVEDGVRRGMHPLASVAGQTLKLLATAVHLQAEVDKLKAASPAGEHFHRGVSTDFQEVLIYAAIVAHGEAGGAPIANIPEGGVRIAMQVSGVEVSARHFLVAVKRHFDRLHAEHMKLVRTEAATLVKGRVRRLVDGLQGLERALRTQLAEDFPEVDGLFEDE